MADDYDRSIAQKYFKFVTTQILESVPGANFSKVMIFVDYAEQTDYFIADPHVDTVTEMTGDDYTAITKGFLKTWLDGFYLSGSVQNVFLVTFDSGTGDWDKTDLDEQYEAHHGLGYWKLALSVAYEEEANVELATLCLAGGGDPLSQFVYGTNDSTILTGAGTEVHWFTDVDLDVPIAYHTSATENAALVALGKTLASVNSTGGCVGNKTDFNAITGWSASGVAGANLTATVEALVKGLGVAYFTTVGNSTGDVVLEKWATCTGGHLIGAAWIVNYIDTVAAIYVAQDNSQEGQGFKNNSTYQKNLQRLRDQLSLFSGSTTDVPRLENVAITAPPFNKLPAAAGDQIIVPKAWQADYVDNLRGETVYGTLFVTV